MLITHLKFTSKKVKGTDTEKVILDMQFSKLKQNTDKPCIY